MGVFVAYGVEAPAGRCVFAADDGDFVGFARRGNRPLAERSASSLTFKHFEAAVIRVGSEALPVTTKAGVV